MNAFDATGERVLSLLLLLVFFHVLAFLWCDAAVAVEKSCLLDSFAKRDTLFAWNSGGNAVVWGIFVFFVERILVVFGESKRNHYRVLQFFIRMTFGIRADQVRFRAKTTHFVRATRRPLQNSFQRRAALASGSLAEVWWCRTRRVLVVSVVFVKCALTSRRG